MNECLVRLIKKRRLSQAERKVILMWTTVLFLQVKEQFEDDSRDSINSLQK